MLSKKQRIKVFVPAAITTFVLALLALGWIFRGGSDGTNLPLNKNWTVEYRNSTVAVENLSDYSLPSIIQKGDTVLLRNVLPQNLGSTSALRLHASLSAVEVYVDDRLVYSYGKNYIDRHKMVGSGYHYIYLPSDAAGKRITFRIISSERNTFSTLPEIYLSDDKNVSTVVFSDHVISFIIGLFLAILGLLMTNFCLFAIIFDRRFYRLLLIGAWALLLGVWSLCYMKTFQIFSMNYGLLTTLEYLSLYFSPIPLFLLIYDIRKNRLCGWKLKGLRVFIYISLGFFGAAVFTHFTDLLHFSIYLPLLHIIVFSSIVYILAFGILKDSKAKLGDRLITYGIIVFGLFAGMDLIRYNVQKYFTTEGYVWSTSFMLIGMLLFVLFLLASYIMDLSAMIADRTEKETLAALVYKDTLTGLFNRAKAEQVFEVLDTSSPADYAIVSIDMNGLKKTNDNYGHSKGDLLIDTFALVLKEAFEEIGTSIRMGGDEFVEIVRAEHLKDLDAALNKMRLLEKEKSDILPIPLSVSYGVAKLSDLENGKTDDVYRLADKRMYEMKMLMHQKRNS